MIFWFNPCVFSFYRKTNWSRFSYFLQKSRYHLLIFLRQSLFVKFFNSIFYIVYMRYFFCNIFGRSFRMLMFFSSCYCNLSDVNLYFYIRCIKSSLVVKAIIDVVPNSFFRTVVPRVFHFYEEYFRHGIR